MSLAGVPMLSACGVGAPGSIQPNGAPGVTGSFDWRKAAGESIKILITPHPYSSTYTDPKIGLMKEFFELTGINVTIDSVPESDYFTKLNIELAGGTGVHDAFMMGAYFGWQYGPPGWIEDLQPWIKNESATSQEYDFDDLFEGVRNAGRWDFAKGQPIGTGGQLCIPWGFETNVITYNARVFKAKGIDIEKEMDSFDSMISLAKDLTDRSSNQYGISFRGSRSWATIHPGFITMYSREGYKDYALSGDQFIPQMAQPGAIEMQKKWVQLAVDSGPKSWTTYDYPNCVDDLANGQAMMVFDADSATYPRQKNSKEAGNLAWHPGPKGRDGSYATNVWSWCWAMNAASKKKLAAWLFIQWVTGKQSMTKAVEQGNFAEPTRKSVFDGAFTKRLGDYPGYADCFNRVIDESTIQFTPQTNFFQTTEDWAVALQDIYGGADAHERLTALAERNLGNVNL